VRARERERVHVRVRVQYLSDRAKCLRPRQR